MEIERIIPCSTGVAWMHVAIAFITGWTTVLTTWLTVRAVHKDKKEANGNPNAPTEIHSP